MRLIDAEENCTIRKKYEPNVVDGMCFGVAGFDEDYPCKACLNCIYAEYNDDLREELKYGKRIRNFKKRNR